jgi:hypothetical protein
VFLCVGLLQVVVGQMVTKDVPRHVAHLLYLTVCQRVVNGSRKGGVSVL